jgi:aspartyl/asparaginyl beta-hydroxylase (cupin superfamily)
VGGLGDEYAKTTPAEQDENARGRRREWQEGEVLLFDDSFEHEVFHDGVGPRVVLIVDVWHPQLTAEGLREQVRRDFGWHANAVAAYSNASETRNSGYRNCFLCPRVFI